MASTVMSRARCSDGAVAPYWNSRTKMCIRDRLKAVGRQKKPVLLKRGLANTLEEFVMSAEYIMAEGNENVILCERGIRTFETSMRNTLDLAGVVMLHKMTHLPVIVDPSHACGHAWMVPQLAKAAVAAGARCV